MGRRNSELKKLEVPYYPKPTDDTGHGWFINTIDEKNVADYCNLNILEVEKLDLIEFLCYRRDARIYQLSQTEDGQDYLKNAWRITETKPDRNNLRNKISKQSGGAV